MDHGKTEAGTFSQAFRGEEGIVDLLHDLGGDASARIADRELHVEAGLDPMGISTGRGHAEIGQIDVEHSPLLPHRVGGVRTEVHDDLMDLRGISQNQSRLT